MYGALGYTASMGVKERIETVYRLLGFEHLSDFARSVGIEPGTAQQQANRGRLPYETARRYVDKAKATGVTVEWLRDGRGIAPSAVQNVVNLTEQFDAGVQSGTLSSKGHGDFTGDARGPVPVPSVGSADLKVYRLVDTSGGIAVLSNEPVALAPRPEEVERVPEAFGVYVASAEMEPAYAIGDYLCISPAVPPTPGKDVLLMTGRPGDRDVRTALRRLVSITDTHWVCKTYAPLKTERFAKAEWPHAPRIVLRRIP